MVPSANAGCAVRRIERLARGLTAFFFGLRPARLRRLLTLTLAAAKGEQSKAKKKLSNPSPTVRAAAPVSDAFLARVPESCPRGRIPSATRNGLLLRPSLMVGLETHILELFFASLFVGSYTKVVTFGV